MKNFIVLGICSLALSACADNGIVNEAKVLFNRIELKKENCHLMLTSENASTYLRQKPVEGNTHYFYGVKRIYFEGEPVTRIAIPKLNDTDSYIVSQGKTYSCKVTISD